MLNQWLALNKKLAEQKKKVKTAENALEKKAHDHYPRLTTDEIKTLIVDDKWLATLDKDIHGEIDRISQTLSARLKELAERYGTTLPKMNERVTELESRVNKHLERMGYAWK